MGGKSSKIFRNIENIKKPYNTENGESATKDPRSPDVLRTPLNELNADGNQQYPFKDPRSPTTCITRTPIVFDSDQSRSFVFEEPDTFNELFSKNPDPKFKKEENVIAKIDPRSPSLQIDRTPLIFDDTINLELPPIVFSDDDEENEDKIIQDVINMMKIDDNEKPRNKPLERVKNMHKKQKSNAKPKDNIPNIYQDSNIVYSTPKKQNFGQESRIKRTPFGCVENRLRLRSRSVENLKYKNGKSFNLNSDEECFKQSKRISAFEIESENNSFII